MVSGGGGVPSVAFSGVRCHRLSLGLALALSPATSVPLWEGETFKVKGKTFIYIKKKIRKRTILAEGWTPQLFRNFWCAAKPSWLGKKQD